MICAVISALLSIVPSSGEALEAMLEEHPFPAAQEAVLIEYGDRFLVPESPSLVKAAVLRQFHRMAFQLQPEPVSSLADYITENWSSLDTETKNLWREFAGRTGLMVPAEAVSGENLTSILRYCSETGSTVPEVNTGNLTDLQRFYYTLALPPDQSLQFIEDPGWAVRNAVLQNNPGAAFEMLDDPSPYVRMNAALAAGRDDLLLEMASADGPLGHMSLAGVGQVPILEDSLFNSDDPAKRVSALLTLLDLGWTVPQTKVDYLLTDDYVMVRAIVADATGRNFAMPEEGDLPEEAPALLDVPDRLVLVTDAGDFTMTLLKEAAPVTCRSFWYLAETGFYNGIYFHRVIPGFVAQAGCPEGNGYGGPGYTIPAENNTVPYRRGIVGMADSGLDTGGSQFFIMLDSQRRLDCRYTVFASVDNTDNLDNIEVGTRILEIHMINP
ncbi:MAG: peptidylprolyl isomerase [Candidatus Fermentibacteraceae bacterium]|nr:peptidylprolyl isomerase [Candidatus Fermentibacteraceae bacterium]